ncbi:MAG TPA: hypothetical protein VL358_09950 [Caulobacteraceae bacterium]|nr:hypothetical protein [Caulobacteraceae bacterium]
MDPHLEGVAEHMKGLGLGALAHANWHATTMSMENQWWSELSVLQAAHAGEILIKARIAVEHPLLIFDQMPKASPAEALSLTHLVEAGRTFQFVDLPDRLWATTGIRLPDVERYRRFGRLRNAIQHFTVPPTVDVGEEALRFIYEVIDPFINECWGLFAIDITEEYDSLMYAMEVLIHREIPFLVSKDALEDFSDVRITWTEISAPYLIELHRRLEAARGAFGGPDTYAELTRIVLACKQ